MSSNISCSKYVWHVFCYINMVTKCHFRGFNCLSHNSFCTEKRLIQQDSLMYEKAVTYRVDKRTDRTALSQQGVMFSINSVSVNILETISNVWQYLTGNNFFFSKDLPNDVLKIVKQTFNLTQHTSNMYSNLKTLLSLMKLFLTKISFEMVLLKYSNSSLDTPMIDFCSG